MEEYSNISQDKLAICRPCPEYKDGGGQCVYPEPGSGKKTGPGTGWPKKPRKGQTCEDLVRTMKIHGSKKIAQDFNPKDTVTMDIPLFIRLLEWAREEAKADIPLHELASRATQAQTSEERPLTMQDYGFLMLGVTKEVPVQDSVEESY